MTDSATAPIKLGILTMSDKGSRGEREDRSGAAIRELMTPVGCTVGSYRVIPDEKTLIAETLKDWSDTGELDLILTTGGTGLSPRDITPEATLLVLERLAPGISELMRAEGLRHTPTAALSRAVAGTRGRTLIVNLPGSERGVRESLGAILAILPHAIDTLRGAGGDH